jgi:tetratricopeptide (TPR) repeat protein
MNITVRKNEFCDTFVVATALCKRVALMAGILLTCWMADTAFFALVSPDSNAGAANAQDDQSKRKTVRTPAMRESIYKKLAQAQEEAEDKDYTSAMTILNEVKADPGLNCYEIAMVWNFIAYVYTTQEQYDKALPAYNNILKQDCVPEALEQQTLYAISQMYLATDRPKEAISSLKKWFAIATPNPQAHVLLGQCYFLIDDFRSSVVEVEKGIALNKTHGAEPRENWLLILRAAYYELGNMNKVTEILEELVRLYPKGEYLQQLSGMYGELGKENLQTLVLEASYDGGYFKKSGEYVSLASLLLNAEVPYKAAKVLEEGIKKKLVDEKINNLKMLAQAYLAAQEPRESIRVLQKAAKMSDDGELYVRLGQSHMGLDEWTACVSALRSGLKKGGIKRVDSAQVSLGICLYNTDNLDGAIEAFKRAGKDERSASFSRSWIEFLRSEKARRQAIEASLI